MCKLVKPQFFNNRWIVVGLLMLAYTFSFMDRYILNLLVEPMKRDFHLSDTQISALLGFSFALFYATMGIPLGKLADTKSRTGLITIGIGLWSTMTICCGIAKNYTQLFLSRMGIGVGEATLSPSAYSLIVDYFPKRLLATAISVYSLGIYLGSGIAYIVGGKLITLFSQHQYFHIPFVGNIYSWQLVFFLFGIPGLILSLFIWMVREPDRPMENKDSKNSYTGFISYLKKDGKVFLLLCAGASVFNIAVYGSSVWMPTFLTRVHHLTIDNVGLFLGISMLVFPSIGVMAGGRIADHYAIKLGITGRIKVMLFATVLFIPANIIYILTSTPELTFVALIPQALLISASVGIGAACIQEIVPAHYRGIASAVFLFSQNFIGMGFGPTCVAALTDYFFCDPQSIGISIAIISVCSLSIAAFIFSKAVTTSRKKTISLINS